jgi:hypothetical protein
MAQLKLKDTIIMSDSSGTPAFTNDVSFPGHIIQIVQKVKSDAFVSAGNQSEQIITGYNCSITPQKTGSKILINYVFDTSSQGALTARSYMERDIGDGGFSKLTGIMGTAAGGGAASLSHAGITSNYMQERFAGFYLDTPSYSSGQAISYRIGVQSESTTYLIHVGRTNRDSDAYHPRTASILILMEVSQ